MRLEAGVSTQTTLCGPALQLRPRDHKTTRPRDHGPQTTVLWSCGPVVLWSGHSRMLKRTPALTRRAAQMSSAPGIRRKKKQRRKVDRTGVAAAMRLNAWTFALDRAISHSKYPMASGPAP